MGLVIATIIITAAYVGFHASQNTTEKNIETHEISGDLKIIKITDHDFRGMQLRYDQEKSYI